MSRSGYDDDCSGWELIRWRGAVNSSLNGRRGQAFLREMLEALDALPEKRLEPRVLVSPTGCCAMGAVAIKRGLDVSDVDPSEREDVAGTFGIAEAMVAEIASVNDDEYACRQETEEKRFARVRAWAVKHLKSEAMS